ncbi:hypothetical protein [Mycolicibacterium llatzerense]|uniref:hypothetical protein n=1 Tax=Mycolicibacterium llatzerense TaxID=280871 RepID=UPI0008DE8142|nr:hypothetical protein [Mycolicibacterium llatzerense]
MSGLDMLNNQRNRRSKVANEMPKPLHPARATPVNLPAAEPHSDVENTTPSAPETTSAEVQAPIVETAPPAPSASAPKRPAATRKPAKSDAPTRKLEPQTVYLEFDEDQFVRRTMDAGRYGKPKVTSASAIVRYAVRQLAKNMTPEQVVAAIREGAPETSNQGRIRL